MHIFDTFSVNKMTLMNCSAVIFRQSMCKRHCVCLLKKKMPKKNMELADIAKVFKVGEIVFIKTKGYPEWPALVKEVHKTQKHFLVEYFNYDPST